MQGQVTLRAQKTQDSTSSETTRRHIPEDGALRNYRREYVKFNIIFHVVLFVLEA
jgi:hypothetical protein